MALTLKDEPMTTDELERVAYMAGDTHTAGLLARIDDLCAALGKATADNVELQQENDILRDELQAAQFDRAYGGNTN
jgi:regulator of replication initiation timing